MPNDYVQLHQKILAAFAEDKTLKGISLRSIPSFETSPWRSMLYKIPKAFSIINRLVHQRVRDKLIESYGQKVIASLVANGILPPDSGISGTEAWTLAFLMELIVVRHEAWAAVEKLQAKNLKNPVFIDCGANLGVFTLWLKINFPDAEVYTFEPVSRTFKIQSSLLSFWGLSSVYPQQLAVGDKRSELKMHVDPFLWGSTLVNNPGQDPNLTETVTVVALDDFLKENSISKLDFLKVDVEGFEDRALKGASKSIGAFKPILYIAGHHRKDDSTRIPSIVLSIVPEYKSVKDEVLSTEFVFF